MRLKTTAIFAATSGALLIFAAGCSNERSGGEVSAVFHSENNPVNLSAWGLMDVSSGALNLAEGVVPYDLNTPLFTDYALKLRTIWVPKAVGAGVYREADYPDLPIGTVISKTFYYPKGESENAVLKVADTAGETNPILQGLDKVRLVETRLLVRRSEGWEAVSYVWNAAQTDAKLTKIGDAQRLALVSDDGSKTDFSYIVPDINQCAGCHAPNNTTRELAPLGVRPRHLNKAYHHDGQDVNQLLKLELVGYISDLAEIDQIKRNDDWTDATLPIDQRARAYLDINCSHCHNPVGPADTSGLDLTMEAMVGPELGVCKLPIAAGSGTGGRAFSIVPGEPDASILLHRVETTNPGAMMPELGRALQHKEGAELLRDWIAQMEGKCSA